MFLLSITVTFQKNDVIPDIFPRFILSLNTFVLRFSLRFCFQTAKILRKTLINVRKLNVYLFLGIPGVRAQLWKILGHSYLLESGGILYAPQPAMFSTGAGRITLTNCHTDTFSNRPVFISLRFQIDPL